MYKIFNKFSEQGIIISEKKMKLGQEYIEFFGLKIGQGKIRLQEHIAKG